MTSVEHVGMLQMPRYHKAWLGWAGARFFFERENQALATRTGDGQVLTKNGPRTVTAPPPPHAAFCIFSCNRQLQGTSTC